MVFHERTSATLVQISSEAKIDADANLVENAVISLVDWPVGPWPSLRSAFELTSYAASN